MNADGKTFCVTGANGFVGRHLVRLLLENGCRVRAALRRTPRVGTPEEATKDSPLLSTHIVGNIDGDTDWTGLLDGVDIVIHLAARVHVMKDTAGDPAAEFRKVNLEGTKRLAEESARAGVKRLVFVSTIKVNGEGQNAPYSEDSPVAPVDAYAESKAKAEAALRSIASETGLEYTTLRPPLVYGPHVGANFLRLLRAMDRRLPLPIGAITAKRSMIHVQNLASALLTCSTHPKATNKTYMVSEGEDISTSDLARRLATLMNRRVFLPPVPVPALRVAGRLLNCDDVIHKLTAPLTVDSSRICKELGWIPPVSLDAGLAETVRWYLTSKTCTQSAGEPEAQCST